MGMKAKSNDVVTVCLRGAGQVFFMESALAGCLFIVAIAYASHETAQWSTTAGAVFGLVVATLAALWLNHDQAATRSGLYGFNGMLTGLALATFVAPSPSLWFSIALGAAVSTVATGAFAAVLTKTRGIPGSTGPFVLIAWLMLAGIGAVGPPNAASVVLLPGHPASAYLGGVAPIPAADELLQIFFRNIAQVFLLESAVSGAIILLGIVFASWRAAVAAAAGSAVAMICALVLQMDPVMVMRGLYGFSPVLTAMAVGVVFLRTSVRVAAYALLATVATVCVQAAFNVLMAPIGLPVLTAPYVLVMYLFVAAKPIFFLAVGGTDSMHKTSPHA